MDTFPRPSDIFRPASSPELPQTLPPLADAPQPPRLDLARPLHQPDNDSPPRPAEHVDITAPVYRRPIRQQVETAPQEPAALLGEVVVAEMVGYPAPAEVPPPPSDAGVPLDHSNDAPASAEVQPEILPDTEAIPPTTEVDPAPPADDLQVRFHAPGDQLPSDGIFGDGDSKTGEPPFRPAPGLPPRGDGYYRLHPVGRYVSSPGDRPTLFAGDTTSIPTGLLERTTYTQKSNDWATDRTMPEYRQDLFADTRPDADSECAHIAGGESEAFKAGQVVLDVGSGQAVAVLQFAEVYPDTTFIGVDSGYEQTRRIDTQKAGVQLTKDDWNTLASIPDESVDTILSQRGLTPWGIAPGVDTSGQAVAALTRVAKLGAVFRFDIGAADTEHRAFTASLLQRHGWEVREVSCRGQKTMTMVATKTGKKK